MLLHLAGVAAKETITIRMDSWPDTPVPSGRELATAGERLNQMLKPLVDIRAEVMQTSDRRLGQLPPPGYPGK